MLLTDEEARKQPCPFFRYVVNESDAVNYNRPLMYAHENCRGSDCKIAWRSGAPLIEQEQQLHAVDIGNGLTDARPVAVVTSTPRGYCGMAGKPDL